MPEASISLSGVNKRFGRTHAVRDLDLVVPAGSLCGFLGPNGAGKSTTIRMIMSIIYPDAGTIDVLGGNALAAKDRIGYLPEERGVYRKMKVGDFLEYMALLKGVPRKGLDKLVQSWLERVQLPDVYRRKCEELSKGMQQKVQFAASVMHDPELLILDEPFSGLDPVNTALLGDLIRELHGEGTTIIFSTHVLHQAEEICDRLFLINHGVKLLDATLDEIHRRFDPRTIVAEPLEGHPVPALNGVGGVAGTRILPNTSLLEIALEDDADPQAIMRSVLSGHALRSIELRQLTLSEVFVRLVQRDEGEEAAARIREELAHT